MVNLLPGVALWRTDRKAAALVAVIMSLVLAIWSGYSSWGSPLAAALVSDGKTAGGTDIWIGNLYQCYTTLNYSAGFAGLWLVWGFSLWLARDSLKPKVTSVYQVFTAATICPALAVYYFVDQHKSKVRLLSWVIIVVYYVLSLTLARSDFSFVLDAPALGALLTVVAIPMQVISPLVAMVMLLWVVITADIYARKYGLRRDS